MPSAPALRLPGSAEEGERRENTQSLYSVMKVQVTMAALMRGWSQIGVIMENELTRPGRVSLLGRETSICRDLAVWQSS